MNITRIVLAAAMTAGLGFTSLSAASASVTATINIVNNNAATTIYHAKNPPSTQSDIFSRVGLSWSTMPPNSLLAGTSDSTAKITLGANDYVKFTYGAPNSASPFTAGCVFTVQANSAGNGLLPPSATKISSASICGGSLPSGKPYNVEVTVGGF